VEKYFELPFIAPEFIDRKELFFLFESSLTNNANYMSYIFYDPISIIEIYNYDDIDNAFELIEKNSKQYYLAGFFSYELGYYFEQCINSNSSYSFPLLFFGVFNQVITFNHKTNQFNCHKEGFLSTSETLRNFTINNLQLNESYDDYIKKVNTIKEYLFKGDTYQVNFTFKYFFDFSGCPFSFYQDLKNKQNVPYSAFLKYKNYFILSLSPELFFRRDREQIYSSPMKGTIKRGRYLEEDERNQSELQNSEKDLAENSMIVDLIRNDLGRISRSGTVKVANLFTIEKYSSLFQMTSTVKSFLRKDITYYDIIKNIFPCGSVTGAPKIRTMEIIKELEKDYRKVYCGALGIIFPQKKAVFNVPIRTVSINSNHGEMGVGSGIVYDSQHKKEFQECKLKAQFLVNKYKPFQLLETILWDEEYKLLDAHLHRLKNSAEYFNYCFDNDNVLSKLRNLENNLNKGERYKIRLLINKIGKCEVEYSVIKKNNSSSKYTTISEHKTDPLDIFLYHKTTNRKLYDSEYNKYSSLGFIDVIFFNKNEELTEGAVSNIILKIKGRLYTPPVSCGLLKGTFRDYFISENNVEEKIVFFEDLLNADKIFLCNSVRGLNEVALKNPLPSK